MSTTHATAPSSLHPAMQLCVIAPLCAPVEAGVQQAQADRQSVEAVQRAQRAQAAHEAGQPHGHISLDVDAWAGEVRRSGGVERASSGPRTSSCTLQRCAGRMRGPTPVPQLHPAPPALAPTHGLQGGQVVEHSHEQPADVDR